MRTNDTSPNDPSDSTPAQEVELPPSGDAGGDGPNTPTLDDHPMLEGLVFAEDGTVIGVATGAATGLLAIEYGLPVQVHPELEPELTSHRGEGRTAHRYFAYPKDGLCYPSMTIPRPFRFWPEEHGRTLPDTDLLVFADRGYVAAPPTVSAVHRLLSHDLPPVPSWLSEHLRPVAELATAVGPAWRSTLWGSQAA